MTDEGFRLPDTFIVGAMKSGTTSLYDWLITHPDVFMSPFKEPRYFCHDLTFDWRYDDLGNYLSLFGAATDEQRVGEASVWYLYSEAAAENIRALCGDDVYIIAMVRNPVDMIYSWHSQLVRMGNEPITDFREAWEAEDDRRAGEHLPESFNPLEGLYYSVIPRFADQLRRYFDVFGRERCHVVVFDDLVADNQATYQEVCQFLGVRDDHDPGFERRNPNKFVRSPWLRDFTQNLPRPIKAVTEALPLELRFKLRKLVNQVNTKVEDRDPLDLGFREELREHFAPEVEGLAALLDRDLSHWNEPPDQAPAAHGG